jgi:diguanylate cyclase (GGDEF)-like protein
VGQGKNVDLPTSRLIFAVLGAAVFGLLFAILGIFVARARLLEASGWVRHTADVELAIAACRIHVREAQVSAENRPALLERARTDVERIRQLSDDNPAQQRRVSALVPLLETFDGDAVEASKIDDHLRELEIVESSLKQVRMTILERATRTGWLVSSANAALTVVLVSLMLGKMQRQSQAISLVHANLRREAAMLASVVDSMVDGVIAITPSRTFLHVNRAARRLLGDAFPTEEFPKDWRSTLQCVYEDGTEMKPEDGALSRAIEGLCTDNLVYKTRQRNDPEDAGTWVSATGRPVCDADGTVIAAVVALRDMTAQRHQQDQLRAMSMSDEMTRLHNRRGFSMLADQHARLAHRHKVPFGIVFADLNGLKETNDSRGHEAGDQMICAVADVLRRTFRESDIIARVGGDEFVALLPNADASMRDTIMARLRDGLARCNALEAPAHRLSLSVGITFFDPEHPISLLELMGEADRLMYADKREQRCGRS